MMSLKKVKGMKAVLRAEETEAVSVEVLLESGYAYNRFVLITYSFARIYAFPLLETISLSSKIKVMSALDYDEVSSHESKRSRSTRSALSTPAGYFGSTSTNRKPCKCGLVLTFLTVCSSGF